MVRRLQRTVVFPVSIEIVSSDLVLVGVVVRMLVLRGVGAVGVLVAWSYNVSHQYLFRC